MQKFKSSFNCSYLYDNSLSFHNFSYETRGSTTKLLPLPKNIHDYIDDFLEVTDSEIPAAYFYHSNSDT